MLGKRKFIIDTFSEIYHILKPWADAEFWDFNLHESIPDSVYLFGRQQFLDHKQRILDMVESGKYTIIFCNAAEGSWTVQTMNQRLGIEQLIKDRKILLISGGEQQEDYHYIQYDHFLCEIMRYEENLQAMTRIDEIFQKTNKPYKFLFLNGRARPHRKYLLERFQQLNILNQSLWTVLDNSPAVSRHLNLYSNNVNLMDTIGNIQYLPKNYEVELYKDTTVNLTQSTRAFIKNELFDNTWGEIYLRAEPYIDTYFSLITETIFEQPWSFRTEKIAKPLMMGHPFIVATSPGYYSDLHRLGFQTFGHVIDESFDSIENHQDRMDRIVTIVQDLCQQDLDAFQKECYTVCKYNQEHLKELAPQLQAEFPEKFFQLIK